MSSYVHTGSMPTFDVVGPNERGEWTVFKFTDHFEVYERHFSQEAAERAKERAESFYASK